MQIHQRNILNMHKLASEIIQCSHENNKVYTHKKQKLYSYTYTDKLCLLTVHVGVCLYLDLLLINNLHLYFFVHVKLPH